MTKTELTAQLETTNALIAQLSPRRDEPQAREALGNALAYRTRIQDQLLALRRRG